MHAAAHILTSFLNKITMYRLMLYFMGVLIGVAIILSAFRVLPYSPIAILAQTIAFGVICWGANALIARLLKIKPNTESPLITALILAAIVGPLALPEQWLPLVVISLAAIASKYIFVIRRSHIFNPAAVGVTAAALTVGHGASWWIGSQPMLPVILLGGLVIMRKIRRWHLVGSFFAVYVGLLAIDSWLIQGQGLTETIIFLKDLLVFTPLAFFAFVMLVEPLTAPQTASRRTLFGIVVGLVLFCFQRFAGHIPYSLELALLVGNIFSRIINPDFRQAFILRGKEIISPVISSFWFEPSRSFGFVPGQFLEYTLGHPRSDSRGVRRYFSIASAPTEKKVLLTTKFTEQGSTFKKALRNMEVGDEVVVSKVAGEFVLPADEKQKLVFIAGGIGITPFRSMVKYLLDTKAKRDIILLYAVKEERDLAFREVFDEAGKTFGMKNVYVLSDDKKISSGWSGRIGTIDKRLIKEEVPDWPERLFYVSGPEPMVQAMAKVLMGMGIARKRIRRDYFPGYSETE